MKASHTDVFSEMKKEDRKFGERAAKQHTAKDHLKREKHPTDFRNFSPKDIQAMSDDVDFDEDEDMYA